MAGIGRILVSRLLRDSELAQFGHKLSLERFAASE